VVRGARGGMSARCEGCRSVPPPRRRRLCEALQGRLRARVPGQSGPAWKRERRPVARPRAGTCGRRPSCGLLASSFPNQAPGGGGDVGCAGGRPVELARDGGGQHLPRGSGPGGRPIGMPLGRPDDRPDPRTSPRRLPRQPPAGIESSARRRCSRLSLARLPGWPGSAGDAAQADAGIVAYPGDPLRRHLAEGPDVTVVAPPEQHGVDGRRSRTRDVGHAHGGSIR
jgi:hypothetical protein